MPRSRSRSRSRHRRTRRRSRERSRDRRDRRDRGRDRDKSRDRPSRDRSRERSRDRRDRRREDGTASRRDETRRERRDRERSQSPLPMPTDPPPVDEFERLDRTVGITQISARLRARDLIQFFEKKRCGRVRDAKIVKDHRTGASKGVAYVEFYDLESVDRALAQDGQMLLGMPMVIQRTEAEKKLLAAQVEAHGGSLRELGINLGESGNTSSIAEAAASRDPAQRRIYVASLNVSLTQDDVRAIFQPFGKIEEVDLLHDSISGTSKGFAFIQFARRDDARAAIEQMNGFELIGQRLDCGWATETESRYSHFGVGTGANAANDRGGRREVVDRLDDDGSGGLVGVSRTELMRKLARDTNLVPSGAAQPPPPPPPLYDAYSNQIQPPPGTYESSYQPPPPPTNQKPTRNCILKNLFNALEETDPNWDTEIQNDIYEECKRLGAPPTHIFLEKESMMGEVWMRFPDVESCEVVVKVMGGRYFGGRMVDARFVADGMYGAKFGEAIMTQ